jgi:hypothetical protein
MFTVRSFAAAVYIVGKGIEPAGIDSTTGWVIFNDSAAKDAMAEYRRIADRLTAMQVAAGVRNGAR